MNKVKELVYRLARLANCSCGSASVYMREDGKQVCMDCGNVW
ncbi:hypothetical protein ACGFX8_36490 [Streptomyces sp. NPDC048362]